MESAVVLKHRPTGTIAEAGERRSQHENLRVALRRLRINLALEHRVDRSGATSPSLLWKSRCRNGRISISERHDDFPTLLAEVLDTVDRFGIDLHDVAEFLCCTRTQLVQFLKVEPRALAEINQRRTALGQKRLR